MPAAKKRRLGAAWAEHIFLDVVGYSKRTIESQTSIIKTLNKIVRDSIHAHAPGADRTIYIPTGDGICVTLLNVGDPFDIQMQVALGILERIREHNSHATEEQLAFEVRIGINANRDNVVVDINGNRNVAGAGINEASRVMGKADGGQILVGNPVFETLKLHDEYISAFRPYSATVKHGLLLQLHQFVGRGHPFLNVSVPSAFRTPADFKAQGGIKSSERRAALRLGGLKIRVEIAWSQAEAKLAWSIGLTREPLTIMALIDTGASATVINPEVAITCGLRRTGDVNISSAGGVGRYPEYVGAICFPGSDLTTLDPVRLVACPLPGQEVACILGRNILERWRLVYDGRTGEVHIED
jgi:gag-polyprotein putative aspartyl protease